MSLRVLLGFALAVSALAQDDPYELLQSKVQAIAKKMDKAFVFFPGGSGSFISEDGYCITNHHVAGAKPEVTVFISDGTRFQAKRIATDSYGDVALFKVDQPGRKFDYVELGDSDALEAGQYVVAVGNPQGLGNQKIDGKHSPTVSLGLVSALHRRQGGYSDCIQTDASVNPGNSGGPLLTLKGEQVGINGRIATRYGNRVNSGVGYAIPSNQIKRFVRAMKGGGEKGVVYHGDITGLAIGQEHTNGAGAKVSKVTENTEAAKIGFKVGDVVVRVEAQKIFSRDRFYGVLGTYPAGDSIEVIVLRDGAETKLTAKLDRFIPQGAPAGGPGPQRPPNAGYLGVLLEDHADGAAVTDITPNTPAEEAGLKIGDLILKVGDAAVANTAAFQKELWKYKPGDKIKITYKRDGTEHEVEVELAKPPQ